MYEYEKEHLELHEHDQQQIKQIKPYHLHKDVFDINVEKRRHSHSSAI